MTRPVRLNKTELRRAFEVARETGMRLIIRRDGSIVVEERPGEYGDNGPDGTSKVKDCML